MDLLRILSIGVIVVLITRTASANMDATAPFATPMESGNGTIPVCQKCYDLDMECFKCIDDGRHACVAKNYKGVCCACIGTGPGSRCLLCASGSTCTRSMEFGYTCFTEPYLPNLSNALNVTSFPEPMETTQWERYPGLMVGYFFLGAGLAIPLPIIILLLGWCIGWSIDHPGTPGDGSWDSGSSSWDFGSSGGGGDSGAGGGGGGGDSGGSWSFSAD